jgi:hypothetical protein
MEGRFSSTATYPCWSGGRDRPLFKIRTLHLLSFTNSQKNHLQNITPYGVIMEWMNSRTY